MYSIDIEVRRKMAIEQEKEIVLEKAKDLPSCDSEQANSSSLKDLLERQLQSKSTTMIRLVLRLRGGETQMKFVDVEKVDAIVESCLSWIVY
ncbi:MAG: hypothetical protein EZS28_032068 [Streblomastix strix]|uniref:Uncharacterized protein n=1 Tax=Streblomastix strix TaxID=222440 RepID=A0A5J4URI0_9EUKA|nr:MAG: hypothetical protein EZS28_032068 [Streblomastix strix]